MLSEPFGAVVSKHPATDKCCSSQQRICFTLIAYSAMELAGLVQDSVLFIH